MNSIEFDFHASKNQLGVNQLGGSFHNGKLLEFKNSI